jgi:site-specific recombinase XerD
MQATARIYFQKAPAKKTKDDLCPVKLCITHNRKRKYYSISDKIKDNAWLYVSEDAIEKITSDSPRGKYRDIAFEYKKITDKAEAIINDLSVFSFNQFEQKFMNEVKDWDNVFAAMIEHIKELKSEDRFSYAMSFESTLRAVKEFHEGKTFDFNSRNKVVSRYEKYLSGKQLNFVDITPAWLKKFEKYLKDKGKKKSTLGIYVRNLRVLFNLAIKKHHVKAEYPFNEHKPKTSSKRKIALTAEQISLIANYQTDDPKAQFYRDMFMFSFLACGMNMTDIARLRYSNIEGNEIVFVRKKTEAEENTEEPLQIPITKRMQSIIDTHGIRAVGYDSFIFPILRPEWDEERKFAEVRQLTKMVNQHLKRIAKAVKIKDNVSSYVARHSWATISKNTGASTEYISEQLGHSSVLVTKSYLKGFEKATRETQSTKTEDAVYNQKAV